MGAGLGYDVACLTDGRFSGGLVTSNSRLTRMLSSFLRFFSSHGFVVGHVVPEAQVGGPIALVRDGDIIHIDAVKNTLNMEVSPEELERRQKEEGGSTCFPAATGLNIDVPTPLPAGNNA